MTGNKFDHSDRSAAFRGQMGGAEAVMRVLSSSGGKAGERRRSPLCACIWWCVCVGGRGGGLMINKK